MDMVPVPSRVFKQYSTWIVIATAGVDAAHAAVAMLSDQHLLSGNALAMVNVGMMFVATMAKLVQQNIAVTPDERAALHDAVSAAPTKGAPPADPPTQPQT